MSEHTPGPWYDSGPHEAYDGDHSIGSVGVRVATVVRDGDNDLEGEANARLIAAAPDLLKALQNLAGNAEAFDWCWPRDLEEARAAISKATNGEAQSK